MKKIVTNILIFVMLLALCGCSTDKQTEEYLNTCTIIVDYSDILSDIESLKEEKRSLVNDSGILFSSDDVGFNEGENAFDVLSRELKEAGIHMEAEITPIYNTMYIKGIGNIYELDCGERSGWQYLVNGESPSVACSDYIIKEGDKIEFIYKRVGY